MTAKRPRVPGHYLETACAKNRQLLAELREARGAYRELLTAARRVASPRGPWDRAEAMEQLKTLTQ